MYSTYRQPEARGLYWVAMGRFRLQVTRKEAALVAAALVAVAFVAFLRLVVFDVVKVEQTSMVPALGKDSTAVIFRLAYGLRGPASYWLRWAAPARGDVVVFRNPFDGALVVKRCAGVGGDPIDASAPGAIDVAGRKLPATALQASRYYGKAAVPAGMVFAAGDNPPESMDSRDYGLIPVEEILGKVVLSF